MKKLWLEVSEFFKDNETFLKEAYPGIKVERLFKEVESFFPLPSPDEIEEKRQYFYPQFPEELHSFFQFLLQGRPLEYITGRKYFYNSYFRVGPEVLIPRNETEILVEKVLEEYRKRRPLWGKNSDNIKIRIVDVGVGPGTILLSLLKEINEGVQGVGIDISPEALKLAKRNYFLMGLEFHPQSSVSFLLQDRFLSLGKDEKFHVIVSNPPYIKKSADCDNVHWQVKKFEPAVALFLEDEEYRDWYKNFFGGIKDHLLEDGFFYLEGHEDHLSEVAVCAQELGLSVELENDYSGRPRFLKGHYR